MQRGCRFGGRPGEGGGPRLGTLGASALILLLAGCVTVGPDYEPPEDPVPDLWHQDLVAGLDGGTGTGSKATVT